MGFSGEVVDWKGKFGYIMPSEPIEHEAAQKKGGKIWASMADIESGATELAIGQEVSFHVYLDDSGILGAEEIEEQRCQTTSSTIFAMGAVNERLWWQRFWW